MLGGRRSGQVEGSGRLSRNETRRKNVEGNVFMRPINETEVSFFKGKKNRRRRRPTGFHVGNSLSPALFSIFLVTSQGKTI